MKEQYLTHIKDTNERTKYGKVISLYKCKCGNVVKKAKQVCKELK